jgi:Glycosyl hydrolase family 12/Cellulose binding domain
VLSTTTCSEIPSEAEITTSAITSGAVNATLVVANQWATGYQGSIRMSNTGATTTSWSTTINLGGTTFSGGWNAATAVNGGSVTGTNLSYNAAIPNQSPPPEIWGFQGSRPNGSAALPALTSLTVTTATGTSTGSTGTGGATATGGSSGAGGMSGTGGASGTGGTVGTGGATQPPPSGSAPTPNFAATQVCAKFGTLFDASSTYFAMNNEFNDSTNQCFTGAGAGFVVNVSNHNIATNGAPASYVAVVRGCHFGTCTSNSNMPKQVSAITTMPSSFSVSPPSSSNYDAAYDIWFNQQQPSAGTGRNNGLEMMIWLNSSGVQPIGSQVASRVSIGGATWDVWASSSASPPVVSYRANPAVNSTPANFNVKPFVDDAIDVRHLLQAGWWLSSIQAGFEIWSGGTNARVNSFTGAAN